MNFNFKHISKKEIKYTDASGVNWRRTDDGFCYLFFEQKRGDAAYTLVGNVRKLGRIETVAETHERFFFDSACDKSYDVV